MSTKPRRGIRILALDGGGIKGKFLIEALKALQSQVGDKLHPRHKVWDMFDIVAGTSAGSIVTAGVLNQTEFQYMDESSNELAICFEEGRKNILDAFFTAEKYNTSQFEELFKSNFGKMSLDYYHNQKPKCLIVAAKSASPPTEFFFRTYPLPEGAKLPTGVSSGFLLWEAVRSSSAAPIYFKSYKKRYNDQDIELIDGGVVYNNPTKPAIKESFVLWPDAKIDLIVSLGTGISKKEIEESHKIPKGVGDQLLMLVNAAINSEKAHQEVLLDLPQNDKTKDALYVRINPTNYNQHVEMDSSDPKVLQKAVTEIREFLRGKSDDFERIYNYFIKSESLHPPILHSEVKDMIKQEKEEKEKAQEQKSVDKIMNIVKPASSDQLKEQWAELLTDSQIAFQGSKSRGDAEKILSSGTAGNYITRWSDGNHSYVVSAKKGDKRFDHYDVKYDLKNNEFFVPDTKKRYPTLRGYIEDLKKLGDIETPLGASSYATPHKH